MFWPRGALYLTSLSQYYRSHIKFILDFRVSHPSSLYLPSSLWEAMDSGLLFKVFEQAIIILWLICFVYCLSMRLILFLTIAAKNQMHGFFLELLWAHKYFVSDSFTTLFLLVVYSKYFSAMFMRYCPCTRFWSFVGDFDVPSSREDVDRDSSWNQWLRNEIHQLFVEALDQFKVEINLYDMDISPFL